MSKITLELEEPIKVRPSLSGGYGLIIEDANKVTHFFLKDGSYDGYDRLVGSSCRKPKTVVKNG